MITRISGTADSKRFMFRHRRVEFTEQTIMGFILRNKSHKLFYCEELLL